MKNILKSITIIAIVSTGVFFNSCQKDPCEESNCQNGGYCVDGTCECPDGYTGTNCEIRVDPVNIRISKIEVLEYPITNGSSSWDTWTNYPDIYIVVAKGNEIIHNQPTFWEEATGATLTYVPNSYIDMSSPKDRYSVNIYDYDSSGDDDFMGGILFTPNDKSYGFPSSFTIDAGEGIKFRLHVLYEW